MVDYVKFYKKDDLPDPLLLEPNSVFFTRTPNGILVVSITDELGTEIYSTPEQSELIEEYLNNRDNIRNEWVELLSRNRVYRRGTYTRTNFYPDNDRFNSSRSLLEYNDVTVTAGGHFVHNNITNGGVRAALNNKVIELLIALNRTGIDARYGMGFTLANVSTGVVSNPSSVINVGGVSRYLTTSTKYYAGGNNACFARWIRVNTGSITVRATYINDQLVSVDPRDYVTVPLTPVDGWVHVSMKSANKRGYHYLGHVHAEDNTDYDVCLDYVAMNINRVHSDAHSSPIGS